MISCRYGENISPKPKSLSTDDVWSSLGRLRDIDPDSHCRIFRGVIDRMSRLCDNSPRVRTSCEISYDQYMGRENHEQEEFEQRVQNNIQSEIDYIESIIETAVEERLEEYEEERRESQRRNCFVNLFIGFYQKIDNFFAWLSSLSY